MTVTTTIQAIGSANNTLTEVEAATKAARESIRPGINIQRGGVAMVSARRSIHGVNISQTLGANSIWYSFRWGVPGYECRVRKVNWGMSAVSYPAAGCLTIGLWRARIDRQPCDLTFDATPTPLTATSGTNLTAFASPPSPLRSGMAPSVNAPGSPFNFTAWPINAIGATSAAGGWTVSGSGMGLNFPTNTPGGDIVEFNQPSTAYTSGANQLRGLGNGQLIIDPNKIASTTVSVLVTAGGNAYGDTTCGGVPNQNPAGLIKLWETGAGDMPLCVEYGEGFVITLNTENAQSFSTSDQTCGYSYQIHYEAVPLDLA